MGKQALNTYVEPEQKAALERIAKRRNVSQATVVRDAVAEYIVRHDSDPKHEAEPTDHIWRRLMGGYYDGSGVTNDHNDIYAPGFDDDDEAR